MSVTIGVLTSGGDAQGMNAALRAVVRAVLYWGGQPYLIREGWRGVVQGGEHIQEAKWEDVANVLHRGGTMIGTARSKEFNTRDGMRAAAKNLVLCGIDRLAVIGGDGSLSGADELREEWSSLLGELVESGDIEQELADSHPELFVVGMVGTIDNDLVGTDTTIGSDSALHRISEAVDAITSTAASHKRSFIIEVMGRHCGYLPLVSAIVGGCDAMFVPEEPPPSNWGELIADKLRHGREHGRRQSLVIVAEGAVDQDGNAISSSDVAEVLKEELGEDPRVTILGHVQRGGAPSAYDRWMPTVLGAKAAQILVTAERGKPSVVLGTSHNRVTELDLMDAVKKTRAVTAKVKAGEPGLAKERGESFEDGVELFKMLSHPPTRSESCGKRIGILHASNLAPGMNAAASSAVRVAVHHGYDVVGVRGSFKGLAQGNIEPLAWGDVEGWFAEGGASLGTAREIPGAAAIGKIASVIKAHEIDALLVIGGIRGYFAVNAVRAMRDEYPSLQIPMVCIPATINNNLPGSDASIGADTALNYISGALDSIKQAASAHKRCFVVETMGKYCGYLALMGAIASGAERVYLHEDGVTLEDLTADVERMKHLFSHGRDLYLTIRNEYTGGNFDLDMMADLFEHESGDLFDVRSVALGHVQVGGAPSPFDRLLAARFAQQAVAHIGDLLGKGSAQASFMGLTEDGLVAHPMGMMTDLLDTQFNRARHQWWHGLDELVTLLGDHEKFNKPVDVAEF